MVGLWADDQVDHVRPRLGLGAFGLGDAAGQRDHRPAAVVTAQPADVRIGLFRCLLANMAGVEHDQVGLVALGSGGHALCGQQLRHALPVIDVHLAAEAFDAVSLGKISHLAAPIGPPAHARKRGRMRSPGARGGPASCGPCRAATASSSRIVDRHRPAVAKDPFEIRQPALAAVPADDIGVLAIVDRDRSNADFFGRRGDRFQQGRSKRQQAAPVPRRPLGKNGQRLMVLQCFGDLPDLAARIPAGRPVDIKSAVLVGDPAEQRRRLRARPSTRTRFRPSRRAKECRASWCGWRRPVCGGRAATLRSAAEFPRSNRRGAGTAAARTNGRAAISTANAEGHRSGTVRPGRRAAGRRGGERVCAQRSRSMATP